MEGNQTRGMKTEMPEPTYHSGTYAYLGTHKDTKRARKKHVCRLALS